MGAAVISLVSGGSRGLGLAIVESLLARGDRVATFSRSGSDALVGLAAGHADRLHVEQLDAADSSAIQGFVARVAARFGRIDHCIANAAIAHEGVLATTRDDEIDAMLAVNVKGSIVLVRECVRQMLVQEARSASDGYTGSLDSTPSTTTDPRHSASPSSPSITLVSSVVARSGSPGLSVYAATKAALEGFAKSLARELGPALRGKPIPDRPSHGPRPLGHAGRHRRRHRFSHEPRSRLHHRPGPRLRRRLIKPLLSTPIVERSLERRSG